MSRCFSFPDGVKNLSCSERILYVDHKVFQNLQLAYLSSARGDGDKAMAQEGCSAGLCLGKEMVSLGCISEMHTLQVDLSLILRW